MKNEDGGYTYHDPEKQQEFKERWSAKSTDGMVYISDIRHAISNSDQYPFPLWQQDYKHLEAQDAQNKTLDAVIAAIDRVPIYEKGVVPDSVNRTALMDYIKNKASECGDAYGVRDVLMDIAGFQINYVRRE